MKKLLREVLISLSFSKAIIDYIMNLPDDCTFKVQFYCKNNSYSMRIHVGRGRALIYFTKHSVCRMRAKKKMDWIVEQFLNNEPIVVWGYSSEINELREVVKIGLKYGLNYRQALALYRLRQY